MTTTPIGHSRLLSFYVNIGDDTLWVSVVEVDILENTSPTSSGNAPLFVSAELLNNVTEHDGVGNEPVAHNIICMYMRHYFH
jgi:hypothetical protein